MAQPTHAEVSRLLLRMHSAGTVRRVDLLHEAMLAAYRVGRADEARDRDGQPGAEGCLED